jgi:hypothetical protein
MACAPPFWSHAVSHAAWRRLIKAHALAGDQRLNQRALAAGEDVRPAPSKCSASARGNAKAIRIKPLTGPESRQAWRPPQVRAMRCRNQLARPILGCVRTAASCGGTAGVVSPRTARIVAVATTPAGTCVSVRSATIVTERCASGGHSSANRAGSKSSARRYSGAHDTARGAIRGAPVVSTRDTRSTRGCRQVADARLGALRRQRDSAFSGPAEGKQCRTRERHGCNRNFSNTRLFHIFSPVHAAPCCRRRRRIWAISACRAASGPADIECSVVRSRSIYSIRSRSNLFHWGGTRGAPLVGRRIGSRSVVEEGRFQGPPMSRVCKKKKPHDSQRKPGGRGRRADRQYTFEICLRNETSGLKHSEIRKSVQNVTLTSSKVADGPPRRGSEIARGDDRVGGVPRCCCRHEAACKCYLAARRSAPGLLRRQDGARGLKATCQRRFNRTHVRPAVERFARKENRSAD